MENFKADITPTKFLDKIMGLDDGPLLMVLDLFGGRESVIDILLKYFEERPDELGDANILNSFDQILFRCSGNETYVQDWDLLWDKLENLPIGILIHLLESNPPGKRNQNCSDVALNYLLSNKYNKSEATLEIYEELKDYFIDEQPEEFIKFREKQHFINELKLFNDLNFIEDKYTEINFEINEIKELLKEIVISRKLENLHQIKLFLTLVNWYAPKNSFDRKYKDAFVLEIFEVDDNSGIPMWSDEVIDLWKEEFYNIDFDWSNSEIIKDQINSSCKNEANYISEQLKINPNYRHD